MSAEHLQKLSLEIFFKDLQRLSWFRVASFDTFFQSPSNLSTCLVTSDRKSFPIFQFNSFNEQSSWKELQRTFDIVHDLCGRMCARKNPSSKGSLQAIGHIAGSCDCAVLWTSTAS